MSSYELRVAPSGRRTLGRLPLRFATAIVTFMDSRLLANPRHVGKPLRDELEGLLSARVGAYRVVYMVDEPGQTVTVVRIDHRADIYRPR
ncbi:MAG: type II toxin-antitoxin system RelE family toxin [Coriobacteriia bacterium]